MTKAIPEAEWFRYLLLRAGFVCVCVCVCLSVCLLGTLLCPLEVLYKHSLIGVGWRDLGIQILGHWQGSCFIYPSSLLKINTPPTVLFVFKWYSVPFIHINMRQSIVTRWNHLDSLLKAASWGWASSERNQGPSYKGKAWPVLTKCHTSHLCWLTDIIWSVAWQKHCHPQNTEHRGSDKLGNLIKYPKQGTGDSWL